MDDLQRQAATPGDQSKLAIMIQSDLPPQTKSAAQRRAPRAAPPAASTASGSGAPRPRADHDDKTRQAPLSFEQLPYLKRDANGRPIKGLAIDYWSHSGDT